MADSRDKILATKVKQTLEADAEYKSLIGNNTVLRRNASDIGPDNYKKFFPRVPGVQIVYREAPARKTRTQHIEWDVEYEFIIDIVTEGADIEKSESLNDQVQGVIERICEAQVSSAEDFSGSTGECLGITGDMVSFAQPDGFGVTIGSMTLRIYIVYR